MSPTPFELLDKNELKVVGVELDDADLNELAAAAAAVFDMARSEVVVTDYLENVLTFDILTPALYPHQLLGRSEALLTSLGGLTGVTLSEGARVESRGMLGWIAADEGDLAAALHIAEQRADELLEQIAHRVFILSTGAEIAGLEVRDTNATTIRSSLTAEGYSCDFGGAVLDDADLIAGTIRTAVGRGYGLVITTGGVGAEAKDQTVEAILMLDPGAATPYLCHFEPGHGRHAKDGVRIAVGRHEDALVVALPGPNDEVRRAMPVLCAGLRDGRSPGDLAEAIAQELRSMLRDHMDHPFADRT
jgi:molybdenum cofactor synthesis domain-containing protein